MNNLGIASIGAITVIAYLVGVAVKNINAIPNKFIPLICGVTGAIFGIVGMFVMPDFPATDIVNALAIGIVSGLAATGINQIGKQLSGQTDDEKFATAIDEFTNGKGDE